MSCKRLTEGEYNKIKKVANAHKIEWLTEKFGYGATVIRQIRRSKNWDDYKKQFVEKKRLERAKTRAEANCRRYAEVLEEQKRADKEGDSVLLMAGIIVLCSVVALVIIIWMLGGF